MKVSLSVVDPQMPRTVFHQLLVEAIERNPHFAGVDVPADVRIAAEDLANETNWPRYGNQASAYLRGQFDPAVLERYLRQFVADTSIGCVINLHPFIRMPQILAQLPHIITADGNLMDWERAQNLRTISMPVLPILVGKMHEGPRPILVSFRGANSHPSRAAFQRLHDGNRFVCQMVDRQNHMGKVDATTGQSDLPYLQLLEQSVFALVPRGDAPFSYRLLEVMSCGCIPIVISDGWVLPFDHALDWPAFSIHLPEADVMSLPRLLSGFSAERVAHMQQQVREVYTRKLSSLDRIVETLLTEVARLHRLMTWQVATTG